jgi:four helix bundle protein
MIIRNFTEIESWRLARILVQDIYNNTNSTALKKDFGLKDQIQRAAVSIMSNIAEGFDSMNRKTIVIFFNYSIRSASEVNSLLFVLKDLKYITEEQFLKFENDIKHIKNLLIKFIKSIEKKAQNESKT